MFDKITAPTGLVAIAAAAGTLFTVSPAAALSPRGAPDATVPAQPAAQVTAAAHAPAVLRGDGDGDGDGGWWWWSSPSRFHPRHHFCGDGFCGTGIRHRFYGGYGGFGGGGFGIDRNVNIVTNDIDIGVQNSNTNIAVGG